jgi:hypothetical protein
MVLNIDKRRKMKVWIENNEKDLLALGSVDFVEGEVDKDKKPTFFILATDANGKEFKVFLKAESIQEHKHFIKDVEQVLRH